MTVRNRGVVTGAILLAAFLAIGCGDSAARAYAGTYSRDLSNEGEVQMKLESDGDVELMLPSPRWPEEVDMKGKATFIGDTLIFKADTAGNACQSADARYVVGQSEQGGLQIRGVGMDTCGGRRAALVGTWQKS